MQDSPAIYSWSDGSYYKGDMREGLRHGYGEHVWESGEGYRGQYEGDRRQGEGEYSWPSGARYVGSFVADKKEGCGVMYLESGSRFEGKYTNDERNGEGTLFYPDGHVDKGIWLGDHLTRLLFSIPEAGPGYQDTDELDTPDLKSRGTTAPKGPLERESHRLIHAAANGDSIRIETLIQTGNVYINVVDNCGHSALLAAAIHGHASAIRLLLDEGAHINLLSDEGFSPLTATFHRLYLLQNCPVLNVHQGCLTSRSGAECTESSSTPSIVYNAELDTLTPSSPSDVSLGEEQLLGQRDVYTTPRFFLGRRSTALDDEQGSNGDTRGLYPEFDGNLNTRLVSAPAHSMDTSKLLTKPILKKTSDNSDEDNGIIVSERFQKLSIDRERSEEQIVRQKIPQIISQGWLRSPNTISTSRVSNLHETGYPLCDTASASDSVSIHLADRGTGLVSNTSSSSLKPSIVHNLESTIDLLLHCGAGVNTASCPLPAIFYPLLAGDRHMSARLIQAGADVNSRLRAEYGGSGLLHLLATQQDTLRALELVKLLLTAGADTNRLERNDEDESLGETDTCPHLAAGRNEGFKGSSPLHLLASRMCDSSEISDLSRILLKHNANPNIVCKGHSPLSLAILNNNQPMIELLLSSRVDINLPLGSGVASAVCIATGLRAQSLRPVHKSIKLIKSLLEAGANLLQSVEVREGMPLGTVVDFANSAFQEDKRCSELAFHSMTRVERQRFLSRSKLLKFLTNTFRKTVRANGMKISQQKLFESQMSVGEIMEFDFSQLTEQHDEEEKKSKFRTNTKRNRCLHSPKRSQDKLYCKSNQQERDTSPAKITGQVQENTNGDLLSIATHKSKVENFTELKLSMEFVALKFCEYCCRSIGVKLKQCNRCHIVYFCSRTCKLRAWDGWHKRECLVVEIRRQKSVKLNERTSVILDNPIC